MSARSGIRKTWRRRSGAPPALAALILTGMVTLLSAGESRAAMTIDGDEKAMVVTVTDVSRRQIMAELSTRFGFKISGQIGDDSPVNGRFRGDLGDVIGRILPASNFLVIYEGGKASKILLSDRGEAAAAPPDPAMRSLQPNAGMSGASGEGGLGGNPGGEGQYIDPSQGAQDPALQDPSMQGAQDGHLPPQPEL